MSDPKRGGTPIPGVEGWTVEEAEEAVREEKNARKKIWDEILAELVRPNKTDDEIDVLSSRVENELAADGWNSMAMDPRSSNFTTDPSTNKPEGTRRTVIHVVDSELINMSSSQYYAEGDAASPLPSKFDRDLYEVKNGQWTLVKE